MSSKFILRFEICDLTFSNGSFLCNTDKLFCTNAWLIIFRFTVNSRLCVEKFSDSVRWRFWTSICKLAVCNSVVCKLSVLNSGKGRWSDGWVSNNVINNNTDQIPIPLGQEILVRVVSSCTFELHPLLVSEKYRPPVGSSSFLLGKWPMEEHSIVQPVLCPKSYSCSSPWATGNECAWTWLIFAKAHC